MRNAPPTNSPFPDAGLALKRHQGLVLLVLFVAVLFPYLSLFRNALVDDAYIHLDYARTLLQSGTWGLRPGLPANSDTAPLHVVLLAAVGAVVGPTPASAVWLTVLCLIVIALMLERISQNLFQTSTFGRIATLALALNPLMVSTIGMSSYLFTALLATAVYCYLTGRWLWLGVVVGLLTVARPDGFLSVVIFLPFLPHAEARRKYLGTFAAATAPWYLFAWIYLGSFIPDTFFIKLGMVPWGASSFAGGFLMYLQKFPLEAALSFFFLPLAVAMVIKPLRAMPVMKLLLSLGLAHFIAYSGLNARPFHWYYSQEIDSSILLACLGLGRLYQLAKPGSVPQWITRGAGAAFVAIPVLGMALLLARARFAPTEMPIHTNWATAGQYQQVGEWLQANVAGESVRSFAEIGTVTYYCPDCYLLDLFSDRHWLIQSAKAMRSEPGIAAAIYRLNYLFLRDLPDLPPDAFVLTSYDTRQQEGQPAIMKWETSTRWAPESLMTLAPFDPSQ